MRHLILGVQHYDRHVMVPSRGALHLRPANETRLRTVLDSSLCPTSPLKMSC